MFLKEDADWYSYSGQGLSVTDLVHVFKIDVSAHFQYITAIDILSEKERLRADRFLHQQSKENYIVGKYFLRLILSGFLKIPAETFVFHQKGKKKPAVDGIEFNISHTKNYIVMAFSATAIGIDVEYLDPQFRFDEVMELCFSGKEVAFVQNSPQPKRGFYTIWTRKEALLKATGEGLVDQLAEVPSLEDQVSRNELDFEVESFLTPDELLISIAGIKNNKNFKLWNINQLW